MYTYIYIYSSSGRACKYQRGEFSSETVPEMNGKIFGQVQWRGGKLASLNMAANSLVYGITWLATSKPPKKVQF